MTDPHRDVSALVRRPLAVLAILALAATVLALPGAGVAGAVHDDGEPGARGIEAACQGAPDVSFADGPFRDELDAALDCVAADAYGPVAQGFGDDTYRPGDSVQRGRMATFVARLLEAANVDVDRGAEDAFEDDDDYADVHEVNINALNALGIYEGRGGRANPEQDISREEFASLIRRALEEAGVSVAPDENGDLFPADCASPHEQNVEALANHGVVQGDGQGRYRCGADVRRGQMGLFLARSLDIGVAEGVVTNPFATSNQSFEVAPAAEATNDVSSGPADDTGRREYTATGLTADSDHVIVLLDAEDVQGTPGQQVSFDGYDPADETTASIEQVHGSPAAVAGPGTASAQETATAGSDGEIPFVIDSTEPDRVVPVVYVDADDDGELDLDGTGLPTEDFGLGGQKSWTPGGAGAGPIQVGVDSVHRDADRFVGDSDDGGTSDGTSDGGDATYLYSSDDTFATDAVDTMSLAEFEGLLTGHVTDDGGSGNALNGDVVTGTYAPGGASTFNVTTDNVPAPTGLEATVEDLDGDGEADDATLTWDASAQPDAVYNVYADGNGNDTFDGEETDTLATQTADTTVALSDATGTTVHVGAEGGTTGAVSVNDPAVTPTAGGTGPAVTDAAVTNDAGFVPGNATVDDEWTLVFGGEVSVASDASLDVAAGGNSATVTNGDNATFSASGDTLTVTLTQSLFDGLSLLSYPLEVTSASGITGSGGSGTAVGEWSDTTIDAGA